MEEIATEAHTEVDALADEAIRSLDAASSLELLCAILLPIVAILIGMLLNRLIDRRPQDSLITRIVNFMGPLLSPALAVAFLMIAGFTLRAQDMELFILPFVWKAAVAWLAMQLVFLVSSRQSAGWVIILVIIPITLLHLFDLYDPVVKALQNAKFTLNGAKITAYGALKSVAALVVLFWMAGFITRATDSRLKRVRGMHVSNRVLVMKFFQIILYFIVFLVGLQVMGVSLTALSVLGGALGVGIGFGLQKIASNFISGIILLFEKSVSVDDLIELADGTTGFIRMNAARYTLIETGDGREIMIPNEEFITQRVTTLTHTHKRGRVEINVGVGYDSDITKVRELMLDAARSHPRSSTDPEPACFMTAFADSSINMVLYFWVDNVIDGRLGPKHDVMLGILERFRANGIDIPYPHQVQINDPATDERLTAIEAKLKAPKP